MGEARFQLIATDNGLIDWIRLAGYSAHRNCQLCWLVVAPGAVLPTVLRAWLPGAVWPELHGKAQAKRQL
ncbi:MAG: hypothetical protein PF501_01215 [Salinisphaera sp.]|jgi:hypothetical protein|nr:hypothetical protein [Salinisphaera sp.]